MMDLKIDRLPAARAIAYRINQSAVHLDRLKQTLAFKNVIAHFRPSNSASLRANSLDFLRVRDDDVMV
jgi:hypothetical protein